MSTDRKINKYEPDESCEWENDFATVFLIYVAGFFLYLWIFDGCFCYIFCSARGCSTATCAYFLHAYWFWAIFVREPHLYGLRDDESFRCLKRAKKKKTKYCSETLRSYICAWRAFFYWLYVIQYRTRPREVGWTTLFCGDVHFVNGSFGWLDFKRFRLCRSEFVEHLRPCRSERTYIGQNYEIDAENMLEFLRYTKNVVLYMFI